MISRLIAASYCARSCDRPLLRLHGKRVTDYAFDDGTTFRVYGLSDDAWQELQLTVDNAPGVCRTVSAVKQGAITLSSPPVGHMSFTNGGGFSEIDVTTFVREHADNVLTFLLIRELKWPGEDTDFAGVELASREALPAGLQPDLLELRQVGLVLAEHLRDHLADLGERQ